MSKRGYLLPLAAVLGVVAVQACSDSDTTTPPGSAGSAGRTEATGGRSGGAGHAGAAPAAGATNETAGQAGESTGDAGAAGAAGATGGAETGGGSGTAGAPNGGNAGATAGGNAGVGGTLTTGGNAGVGGNTAGVGGNAGVGGASGGTAGTGGATSTTFTLQTTTLGQVIATAAGKSLYVLKTDTVATATTPPVTTCTDGCLAVWPIYYGTPISVPVGLQAADFGSYDRGGGVMQSTYKGWPLYTYTPDASIGDVSGEGIGAKWYTAKSPFVSP